MEPLLSSDPETFVVPESFPEPALTAPLEPVAGAPMPGRGLKDVFPAPEVAPPEADP